MVSSRLSLQLPRSLCSPPTLAYFLSLESGPLCGGVSLSGELLSSALVKFYCDCRLHFMAFLQESFPQRRLFCLKLSHHRRLFPLEHLFPLESIHSTGDYLVNVSVFAHYSSRIWNNSQHIVRMCSVFSGCVSEGRVSHSDIWYLCCLQHGLDQAAVK